MISSRFAATTVLAIATAACTPTNPPPATPAPAAMAQQQPLPPGRVYSFHSGATASCPALDWHVVLGDDNSLTGMISWDGMRSMAHASGMLQGNAFQMTAKEVGGRNRTATVDGTVNPSTGWLTANIKAPNLTCTGIEVPWFRPTTGGGGR